MTKSRFKKATQNVKCFLDAISYDHHDYQKEIYLAQQKRISQLEEKVSQLEPRVVNTSQ